MTASAMFDSANQTRRMETWNISRLKSPVGPMSSVNLLSKDEIDAVATNMLSFGQEAPVAINASGWILGNDEIVLAAEELGWKEIDVVVYE